jgi:DNA repair protein RadA/Sms
VKARRVYVCQSCGHQAPKWLGRCPSCETWSSLVEEVSGRDAPAPAVATSAAKPLAEVTGSEEDRTSTGIAELDRVLGGGLVPGALVLVGGDPGIGKSTLLLQAMGALAARGERVLYASAEESAQQVKMRAERLGIAAPSFYLLADTKLESVEAARREVKPTACVIDSIQTMGVADVESPIGSVSQIRALTDRLMTFAKREGVSTFVVGHVTKEGAIAGPKTVEHMVDTVLYFEGERTGPYRILRAHKNRFGSAQEIGVFEMHPEGLKPVPNPSAVFLAQRAEGPGAAVVTSLEGTRPILLEVQALTTASAYGTARRTTIGFDTQRAAMLCAVLEARAGFALGALDVYVNIAGGVRITEPAADLGVALALASATSGRPVPKDLVLIGEVGLAGEVRGVSQLRTRIAEARALGFERCVVPRVDLDRWQGAEPELPLLGARTLSEALRAADLV